MQNCYKISNPKDLKEFAAESGLNLEEHPTLGVYGLSSKEEFEDIITIIFSSDGITMSVRNYEDYDTFFDVNDWEKVEFTISKKLTILILNGILFLKRS